MYDVLSTKPVLNKVSHRSFFFFSALIQIRKTCIWVQQGWLLKPGNNLAFCSQTGIWMATWLCDIRLQFSVNIFLLLCFPVDDIHNADASVWGNPGVVHPRLPEPLHALVTVRPAEPWSVSECISALRSCDGDETRLRLEQNLFL